MDLSQFSNNTFLLNNMFFAIWSFLIVKATAVNIKDELTTFLKFSFSTENISGVVFET